MSLLRRNPMKRPPAKPGSGIRPEQRTAVHLRDNGHCVRCGAWLANVPSSIQHRVPRSRGGDDRLSNLLHLCGTGTTLCHGEVESQRLQAYDDGYSCRTGEDPADVPVLTWSGWRFYGDDGSVLTRDEYEAVAR